MKDTNRFISSSFKKAKSKPQISGTVNWTYKTMPIHPRELYPAMKKNVPQLHAIRMHLTYLKEKQDQGNKKSIV